MKLWVSLVTLLALLFAFVAADDGIACNSTLKCPEDKPCCSQYGMCGTGSYCLGGCDIRYSFNLSACMPMPIMKDFNQTFASLDVLEKQNDYLGNASSTDWVYTGYIDEHDDNILVQMPNGTTGTVISSSQYLWYGKVLARMKSSRTAGVVTAFILFSDVQDEIDLEFVGYDLEIAQSNYYSQGILNYTNSVNLSTTDTFSDWHLYEFDWSEDRVEWSIDGNVMRTLNKNDTWNATTNKYNYPQTPSRIQVSIWPAGSSLNGVGTIAWAGGAINWDSEDIQKYGYFYAYLDYISVENYDLPDGVKLDGISKVLDANAYLYNLTSGNQGNITLVNKKTWLGSSDASGLDPDNEDKNVTTVILLGLSVVTRTTNSKASIKTSNNILPTTGTDAQTTQQITTGDHGQTILYNLDEGFVQDFNNKNGTSQLLLGFGVNNDVFTGITAIFIGFLSYII